MNRDSIIDLFLIWVFKQTQFEFGTQNSSYCLINVLDVKFTRKNFVLQCQKTNTGSFHIQTCFYNLRSCFIRIGCCLMKTDQHINYAPIRIYISTKTKRIPKNFCQHEIGSRIRFTIPRIIAGHYSHNASFLTDRFKGF